MSWILDGDAIVVAVGRVTACAGIVTDNKTPVSVIEDPVAVGVLRQRGHGGDRERQQEQEAKM